MPDLVVSAWVLRLSLWVMAVTAVLLALTIVLARIQRRRKAARDRRQIDPIRRDVLTIASGDDEDGSSVQRLLSVPLSGLEAVDGYLVSLLSKVRGAPAQQLVGLLQRHGVVRRARDGLASSSGTRRARSAWAIGLMRVEGEARSVAPLLQDSDRGAAVTAARALGMLREDVAAGPLLRSVKPARRGRGALPAWVVTEALAQLGPGTADTVGAALLSDDPTTRAVAARAIGVAQHVSQRESLRSLLATEEDQTVLAAVAEALGRVGRPDDIPSLVDLAAPGHHQTVRLSAVRALSELGGRGSVTALAGLLSDEDARVGELAAQSLVDLDSPGIAALHEVAERTSDEDDVTRAATSYGLALLELRAGSGTGGR